MLPCGEIQFVISSILLLSVAAVQHTINTDFARQLANNSMSYNYWARTTKDRRRSGAGGVGGGGGG